MARGSALINKDTLSYICSKKGVSSEFVVSRTNYKHEKVILWLNPSDPTLPTINQAKSIASCLHIPFAGLYMNSQDIPLQRIPNIKNLRTLQGAAIDDSALNIAVIDILQERAFLIEANNQFEINTTVFSPTVPTSNDPLIWARSIREQLGLSLERQFSCTSTRQFYLYLREAIEKSGVFVHCFTDVTVECARGFAIYEGILPVIGVNDEDRPPAKSFTLVHELVHLYKRDSSYCNDMVSLPNAATEEIFCNAVAGELLVPEKALGIYINTHAFSIPFSLSNIIDMAEHFSVSREVIIRRLLKMGKIDSTEYETYAAEFQREIEREREERRSARKNGIPISIPKNVSREAIDRTSPSVSRILYLGFTEEVFSKQDIARHLGIAQKHINKYLLEVAKWSR